MSSFELAAEEVQNFMKNGGKISDDNLLALYKYYKQATTGDCNTQKPGGLNPFSKDKAKWEAWNSVKGTSQDQAKEEYVKVAKSVLPANVAETL